MSGHNRWTQIKRRKEKTDFAKGRVFSKFAKLIANEARAAKGNRDAPALRAAIERARKENMPNDNIERAIKKATESKTAMESVTYECYGPGGAAIIIEALTDNRNKAAQEIKFILSKHGFALAGMGAASWAFAKEGAGWKPLTTVPLEEADLELLGKLVDELENNDEVQEVFTNAE